MPKRLKRIYGSGDLHFITFSCYRRLPLLASPHSRDIFVDALRRVRAEYGFKLVGYVLMPEHVHLLISESARGTPSTVLKMLKQRVSRQLRSKLQRGVSEEQQPLPFAQALKGLPQFWQRRFYDFNVLSHRKKVEKLDYMHRNPVKRGLVEDPKDWRWSSYSFYQGRGAVLIEMDVVE
jgi:putative transposase